MADTKQGGMFLTQFARPSGFHDARCEAKLAFLLTHLYSPQYLSSARPTLESSQLVYPSIIPETLPLCVYDLS